MGWFRLSLQDNDSYAFREYPQLTVHQHIHQAIVPDMSGTSCAGVRRCEVCGELQAKWDDPLTGLIVKRRNYDISVTYDGVVVATTRFKLAYEDNKLLGLIFRPLPNDAAFFAIYASRAVQFDAERRKTRFIDQCPQCGHFESVVGATPVYLKAGAEISDREFVRTDLEFGSNDEKSPILMCGEMAEKAISQAQLNGFVAVSEIQ